MSEDYKKTKEYYFKLMRGKLCSSFTDEEWEGYKNVLFKFQGDGIAI